MQIYTHTLVGVVIGAMLAPQHKLIAMAIGAVGGFFPDSVIGLQMLVDKLAGRKPLSAEKEGTFWFWLKEMSHSPLWLLLGGLLVLADLPERKYITIFFGGFASHWMIDIFTHHGSVFKDTDQSLAFPFYQWGWCPKLGHIFGIWEYRYNYFTSEHNTNMFTPKSLEVGVCVFLLLVLSYLLVFR